MSLLLIIVLVVLLVGSVPHYSYSRNWGYAPSGGLLTILLVFLLLMFMGVLPRRF
jgi:hypothetical protein